MLAESIFFSIITGKLRGKKIKTLEKVKIDRIYLVFISFLIEFISSLIIKNNIKPFSLFLSDNYFIVHIVIYIFLFIFVLFNRNHRGFLIILIGIILNFIVITANKGYMPVNIDMAVAKGFNEGINMLKDGYIAGHSVLIKGKTNLWLLGDIINIPPPYPFPQTISIGDIFIALGAFLFIQNNMKKI
jgi:hypothetical protein